ADMARALEGAFQAWLLSHGPVAAAGAALALFSLIFVIGRVRYHFQTAERWSSTFCPRCGAELYRVHRSSFDRLLSHTLLPSARRYACSSRDCSWSGLRRHHFHSHSHS
ncbi:MAG: hypothetical protein ACKOC5_02325, partial [Chloroflexota bacterium]